MVMMLITVATGIGLQHKIREKVAAFNGHIVISSYDTNASLESWTPITNEPALDSALTSISGITHVQGVATKAGVIRTESDFEGVVVKGVGQDYRWNDFEEYLIEGRLPKYDGVINDEVLISAHTANRLQFSLGDKVITYFLKKNAHQNTKPNIRAFRIVGIYSSGFQEFDEAYLFADIRHILKMNKWEADAVGSFEVFIDDFDQIEEKGLEIYQNTPSHLDSQTIALKYGSIFEWLKLFDMNIIGIIAIIILVSGINMITALLVLILERTPMIGILKALGTSSWRIRKIFLYNAAYLILVGLFWGNCIGLGLLFIQDHFGVIALDPATYYVNTAPVYIDIGYVLILNAGTLVLCLCMLLIPSYVIAKVSPVKAIRFQ